MEDMLPIEIKTRLRLNLHQFQCQVNIENKEQSKMSNKDGDTVEEPLEKYEQA